MQWRNEISPWSGSSRRWLNRRYRTLDLNTPEVERFFCPIPENGDQVLRVAVNTRIAPWRVVSVFFHRNVKGKL